MRILLYHPVKLPVLQYGGTERVLMWLAQTLLKKGHQVTVFAAPGSSMPDGIECLTDPAQLLACLKNFDVVHGFTKLSSAIENDSQGRVMVTIHGNGKWGEKFHRNTVFLSRDHAIRHGATEFVYNGIDPRELLFNEAPRADRCLFLSKTSLRVKNAKGAARIASRCKQNLWIAGGDRPISLRTFTSLKKMMGADWKWLGSLDQKQKAQFLIEGKALLFPILWNEPFGLVIMESLVSGTPVLANGYGSVPELLSFAPHCVMKSDAEWKQALMSGMTLPSAKVCRDWVMSTFTQDHMTENYLKLYEKVAAGKFLHDKEPETKVGAEEIKRFTP